MSKKIIIISSICLSLITAGGTFWFVFGKQNSDESTSFSQETLNNKEPSSTLPEKNEYDTSSSESSLFTETELVASTITETLETTESVNIAKAEAQDPKEAITSKVSVLLTKTDVAPKKVADNNPVTNEPPNSKSDPVTEKTTEMITEKSAEPATEKPAIVTHSSTEPTKDDSSSHNSGNKSDKAESTSKTTEKSTEAPTEPPTTIATEKATEKPVENVDEPVKCSHTWVWKTHTETKTIPEKTHEVPVYDDGWDEAVTVRKIYCSECEMLYEDNEDYYAHDKCHGSFGHMTVIDHYIHHEPELLFIDTVVDEPAHEETITVKDYEYCSKCGERK